MSGSLLNLPARHRVMSGPNATDESNGACGRFIVRVTGYGGQKIMVTLDVDDGIASGTGWERVTVHHARKHKLTVEQLEEVVHQVWPPDAIVMKLFPADEALLRTPANGIHLWRDQSDRSRAPTAETVEAGWTPPAGWA